MRTQNQLQSNCQNRTCTLCKKWISLMDKNLGQVEGASGAKSRACSQSHEMFKSLVTWSRYLDLILLLANGNTENCLIPFSMVFDYFKLSLTNLTQQIWLRYGAMSITFSVSLGNLSFSQLYEWNLVLSLVQTTPTTPDHCFDKPSLRLAIHLVLFVRSSTYWWFLCQWQYFFINFQRPNYIVPRVMD
jgi:hypothetical protein